MPAQSIRAKSGVVSGWRPLEVGDVVDIIAPSFPSQPDRVVGAVQFLKSWGLVPRLPRDLFGKDLLCANRDEMRFKHLREALYSPDSKAVWCLRGGYGGLRLIPDLAKLKRPAGDAKLFIGLSDITSLHVALNQQWGWPTVHGPLLDRLGRGLALPKYEKELKRFVFGDEAKIAFKNLRAMNKPAREGSGEVRATVTGGNLIVLQSSLGTRASWETKGRILFFEDVGERGYRLDRVLEQFRQVGLFHQAKAIVFGQFNEGDEPEGAMPRNLIWPTLKRFAESLPIPVYSGLESGHDVIQRPLPLGTKSILQLGSRGELVCATGAQL